MAAGFPIGCAAAQEPVQILHDPLCRQQQPGPAGEFPDPVTGMLHGLIRRPAGKERHGPFPVQPRRAHQPVVKPQEVQALTLDSQVHYPGLGLLGLQPELGQ